MAILSYQRLDDILELLLLNQQEVIPLSKLVSQFEVSDRTIRNDISLINENISKQHAKIILHRGKGYQIAFSSEDLFLQWWKNQKKSSLSINLETSEDRQNYLLYLFLSTKDFLNLEELMDTLFVSKNTFYNYLKVAREVLLNYQLKIYNRPNLGFELIGTEFNKRQAIIDLFIKQDLENYVFDFSETEYKIFQDIDLDYLKEIEIAYLSSLNLFESDYYHKNILSTLALCITRIKNGFMIEEIPYKVPSSKPEVKVTFDKLLHKLEREFKITFNKIEREYLYYHLLSNYPKFVDTNQSTIDIQVLAENIVKEFLDDINASTYFDWTNDHILIEDLTAHIRGFMGLEQFNNNRANPLLEMIKKTFPLAYDLSLIHLEKVCDKYGIYFSEDEIGYIALHLAGAIERNESFQNTRLRCIIVCGSGLTMSKIIQIKLEKKYGDLITVVKKYSYLELQQANLSGIDLIITTIPIKHDTIPVTVIDMNHLDKEIERLKETINYSLPNSNRIFQLFSSDQFHVINDEQLTKEQLLKQMCQRLVDNGAVPEQFFESVWEREQIESTNINQNIALPHPMQLISNKSSVSVAIIPNGIEWGNDSVVHFIFLLSIQKKEYKNTEQIYDLLLSFMNDETIQETLLKYPEFHTFIYQMKQLDI